MDRKKIGYAVSAIWCLVAMPLSEEFYEEVFYSGIFMRIFAFILVISPVWLVLGWRWLTENKAMPAKLWISISLLSLILAYYIYNRGHIRDLAIIPILSLAPFMFLIWNYQRGEMKPRLNSKIANIMPSKNEIIKGSDDLLKITEELANDILRSVSPFAIKANLPFPLHSLHITESFLCAYSILYLNLQKNGFKNTKAIAIFAWYKNIAMSNYISLHQIPGFEPLTGKDLETPEAIESAKALLKMREKCTESVIKNIARNNQFPLYPIYESLRPLLSKSATPSELNHEFSSIFSMVNSKANIEIESFLQRHKLKEET